MRFDLQTTLTVYPLPIVNDVTVIQCDDDLNAITSFNLTVKNNVVSNNSANFSYYESVDSDGNLQDPISTPLIMKIKLQALCLFGQRLPIT
jgi:hypothetical protein